MMLVMAVVVFVIAAMSRMVEVMMDECGYNPVFIVREYKRQQVVYDVFSHEPEVDVPLQTT